MLRHALVIFAMLLLAASTSLAGDAARPIDWEKGGDPKGDKPLGETAPQSPAKLPRVLLIGDSISIGYTGPVKEFLKGKAEVIHPRGNCQDSGTGVKNIEEWIGKGPAGKWDVIHFNFGIWDTHYLTKSSGALVRDETNVVLADVRIRATPDEYRANLKKIVAVLKTTGARLVWASTTPIMYRKGERFETIVKYNQVAAEVMKEEGIEVDDLYSFTLPEADKYLGGDKVHFNPIGNAALGEKVANAVLKALKETPATQAAQ